jgi:putative aldouronate transport system permease protein
MKNKVSVLKKYGGIYLFITIGFLYFALFKFIPIIYNYIAFINYNPMKGVFGSPFVGLKYFKRLFTYSDLAILLRNTFIISGMRIAAGFWVPILFTLLLHDFASQRVKSTIQTIIYFPHFVSWVVVAGLTQKLLSPSSGLINLILIKMGAEPHHFMIDESWFRWILVFQGIWKESGFGTIIYLAALSGVSPDLYEAAKIDGCGKWQIMRYINIPSLIGTAIIMLLLAIGRVINQNFAQVFVMLSPTVYNVGEVFETYVFRVGIMEGQVSYTTAVSLFKSIVAAIMVVGANTIIRRSGRRGIY